MTDAELVELARAGDVAAFAGLFERHRPALYARAISMLRDRDAAEDAVQDTCLAALARLSSLRNPDAVAGWLLAILRNACLMELRAARRQPSMAWPAGPSIAPEQVAERHALRDWVWTALESLPPDDRATVMLRHFSRSSTYAAIADITAVPIGTVRSRLNRSRGRLADELRRTAGEAGLGHGTLEAERHAQWAQFYADVQRAPGPRPYVDVYTGDVRVRDSDASWDGIATWSSHEREAIELGVRARLVDLQASRDVTILEIDFANPDWANDHCPPRATFVHRLVDGRSRTLQIAYV